MSRNPCKECLVKPCCNEPCKKLDQFRLTVDKQSMYISFIPVIVLGIIGFSVSLLSNFYEINIFIYFVFIIIMLGSFVSTALYIESIKKFIKKQLMKR